eukprot:12679711-Alexandrium_andersonii.AAC.1
MVHGFAAGAGRASGSRASTGARAVPGLDRPGSRAAQPAPGCRGHPRGGEGPPGWRWAQQRRWPLPYWERTPQ